MKIGQEIKEARLAKHWTQSELAERCGLSLRTIQRLEKDEVSPSLFTSSKIEEALGLKLNLLPQSSPADSPFSKFKKNMQNLPVLTTSILTGVFLITTVFLVFQFSGSSKTTIQKNKSDLIQVTTINCGTESECDIQVTRKNEKGEILWQKNYGGSSYDKATAAIQANDKGFLILGSTSSYGQGNYDILLIKVDEKGEFLWQKTFGGFFNEYANEVEFLENGKGILIKGSQQTCNTPNVSQDCTMQSWQLQVDWKGEQIG